jgi:hypothetical protein
MKINGVEMQIQYGCKEIMTSPVYQRTKKGNLDPDYIEEFGCLLIAKLNCRNLFYKSQSYMTIQELNKQMRERKGYYYLMFMDIYNHNIKKVKEACFGQESFARKLVLNDILGIKKEKEVILKDVNIRSKNDYYYVRTRYKDTGHYSLLLNEKGKHFDSYDGQQVKGKEILNIYQITF